MADRLTTRHLQWIIDSAAPFILFADSKAMAEELIRLRRFAGAVLDCHTGSIDGCEIQSLGVTHGVMSMRLVWERRAAGCREGCQCDDDDICYWPCYDRGGTPIMGPGDAGDEAEEVAW